MQCFKEQDNQSATVTVYFISSVYLGQSVTSGQYITICFDQLISRAMRKLMQRIIWLPLRPLNAHQVHPGRCTLSDFLFSVIVL